MKSVFKGMEFQTASRDANLLVSGEWRLASVEEAKSNLEEIKRQGILETWSILRLLDGWVKGSGYNYEIEQGYKSIAYMSEMLLLKTTASRPSGKQLSYYILSSLCFISINILKAER